MPRVNKWGAYCPFGEKCGRGNRCLGSFDNPDGAQDKIRHHLINSSHHYMSEDEARAAALDAVQCWSEDEDASTASSHQVAPAAHASTSAKAAPVPVPQPVKGKGKGKGKRDRSHPYSSGAWIDGADVASIAAQVADHLLQTQAVVTAAEETTLAAASSTSLALESDVGTSWTRAIASLTRCDQASRTAARMSRSAAAAFEEEAHTISREIEFLSEIQFVVSPH